MAHTKTIQAANLPVNQRRMLHRIVGLSAERQRGAVAWPAVPMTALGVNGSPSAAAALASLEHLGLITVLTIGRMSVCALTARGVDVAQADPVVARPTPPADPKRWSEREAATLGDLQLAHELRRLAVVGPPEVRALVVEAARRIAG